MSPGKHDLRLVPAAVTVWAAGLIGQLGGWWLAGLCGVAAVAVAMALLVRCAGARPRSAAAVLLVAGVLSAGALTVVLREAAVDPLRAMAERGGQAVVVMTTADRARPIRTAGYANEPGIGRKVIIRATVERIRVDGVPVASTGRVLVVAPSPRWARLLPGQQVWATGSLAPARAGELTVAVLQIRGPPEAVTAAPWWQRAAATMREDLRTAAAAVLDPDEAGLLPGLVVGDTSAMPQRVADEFLDAGMSHLVAVSGSNVAVVVGAVFVVLRLLRIGPRTSAVAAGCALIGFLILVGYEPSVLRASVMGAVGLLALALGRQASAMPALAFAVAALVLFDPAMAVSFGFALSVVATGALVLLAPVWAAALHRRSVPPGVAEAVAVPLAAFAVTAPIIAGMAGEVSLVTVAANVFAAPVVAFATVFGVLAAVTAGFAPWLAELFVWLAGPEASWLVLVARTASGVPGAVIDWPDGWWGGLLAAVVCAGVVLACRAQRLRMLIAAVLAGVLIIAVPVAVISPGWPPAGWTLVACDVGQGDGLVLSTGEPGRGVVIDTGTELGEMARCLDRLGVDRVPLLVLSHLHADHIGGLAAVLGGRAVGGIAVGPGRSPGWAWRQVTEVARRHGVGLVELAEGRLLDLPNLGLRVIGPRYVSPAVGREPDGSEINNASLVIMADTRVGRVLLTGDVELAAQADLIAADADVRAEVLKVPHHGSRFTLPAFLNEVGPAIAVISVGGDNRYGHPNQGTVAMLRRAGALVMRTDTGGDIAIVAAEDGPIVVRRK